MSKDTTRSTVLFTSIAIITVPLLCCLLLIGQGILAQYEQNTVPPVTSGLRGGVFMIIRLSASADTIDQIWINEDGTATRGSPRTNERLEFYLTLTEQQAIQKIARQWCLAESPFHTVQSQERNYQVGLLCKMEETWWIKQLQVPIKDAPAILTDIIRQVPKPAQR